MLTDYAKKSSLAGHIHSASLVASKPRVIPKERYIRVKVKRAMLLCAGRGQRLRPLTDRTPKPLIEVNSTTLLDYQLDKLQAAGFTEIMINVCWLADKIIAHIEHSQRLMTIHIQQEEQALETGGGIARALPWLCQHRDDFIVVNADIWHDFDVSELHKTTQTQAHLILSHHRIAEYGDFDLQGDGKLYRSSQPQYVFTGMSGLHQSLFNNVDEEIFPLSKVLFPAIDAQLVSGQLHRGIWSDVGSHDRLAEVRQQYA